VQEMIDCALVLETCRSFTAERGYP